MPRLLSFAANSFSPHSGQFAEGDVLEVDRRAFGLQADEAGLRVDAVAAGDFFTVDPQADLAVDRPHVIVVPLAESLGEVLAREASATVGRSRREWLHLRLADGE